MSSYAHMTPHPSHNSESIIAFFSKGAVETFTKRQVIVNGYEEPKGVYLLKRGHVKAYTITNQGMHNLFLLHGAGDLLPLPWALDGQHPTGLYYEAMSNTVVVRSSKDELRSAIGKNAWLSQDIFRQAVSIIAFCAQRIQTLEHRSSRQRVVSELLFLSSRFGRKINNESVIDIPLTHQDLADSVNLSRETTSKALEVLFKQGLLLQQNHLFVILDEKMLHKIVD